MAQKGNGNVQNRKADYRDSVAVVTVETKQ